MISPAWPTWVAIATASFVGISQLLQESEKFANLLGRFGRGVHERARKRYRMDTKEFNDAVAKAVDRERDKWEEDEGRALTSVEEQLKFVVDIANAQRTQLEELSFQVRCMTTYTEYEAMWHHKWRLAVISAAHDDSIPLAAMPVEHVHYADFERRCRENRSMNWRDWIQV
jgi:hypothetical protein